MIVDYHMHLRRAGNESDAIELTDHSLPAVERYVEAARAVGVDEIGVSEHVYYFTATRDLWHIPYQLGKCVCDVDAYVEAIAAAKRRGLPVKLGVEVDFDPERIDDMRAWLDRQPWDYVLGSVHFVDDFGVDSRPRLIDEVGLEDAWRKYFDQVQAAAASGLFDSLAHPDLVKIWGERPSPEVEQRLYDELADAVAEADICIEVSTRGLLRPVADLYPDARLLAACRARSIPLTLASDAHDADRVGWSFDRAIAGARSAGYETVAVFDGRERREVALG